MKMITDITSFFDAVVNYLYLFQFMVECIIWKPSSDLANYAIRFLSGKYKEECAQKNVHRRMCTEECAQKNVHRRMCTEECAQKNVHRRMCTEECAQKNVHRRMCTEECAQNFSRTIST